MLNLYRLHEKKCSKGYARLDRAGMNCNCPVHVEGKVGDNYVRRSTGTRSITRARKLAVEAEERGKWEPVVRDLPEDEPTGTLVSYATKSFLAECDSKKGKNLGPATVSKYKTVLNRLAQFCERKSIKTLDQITLDTLKAHRNEWLTGPQATANNIARLRSFWKYAVKHDWCQRNLALDIDLPKNYQRTEREPFTEVEMAHILKAAREVPLDPQQTVTNWEIETFILVMRWSGMAIADASLLQAKELRGDEVRYMRKKTRHQANAKPVIVPLPAEVLSRLHKLELFEGRYFFCRGSDHLVSAVDVWHSRLRQVFEHAKIKGGTSHRFRHTFATDLLTKGVSIELVSRWLGHSSVKITEKHYSHFIEDRIQAASNVLRDIYRAS